MNSGGMMLMSVSWLTIISLVVFCFARIFKK